LASASRVSEACGTEVQPLISRRSAQAQRTSRGPGCAIQGINVLRMTTARPACSVTGSKCEVAKDRNGSTRCWM
jgi:hypothetical protein